MAPALRLVAALGAALAVAHAPAVLPAQDAKLETDRPAFKRRDAATDEELRKLLLQVPEVGFNQALAAHVLTTVEKAGAGAAPDLGPRMYVAWANQSGRPDLYALPWRTAADAVLGKERAEGLQVYSVNLRTCMRQAVPAGDIRPDADKLKDALFHDAARVKSLKWDKADCIPAVAQMLQGENTALRGVLVECLAKVGGKEAGFVLAQRALFDLSPEVRQRAVEALAARPVEEYRQVLLDGLRWPWPEAVADHAAEAIAALRMQAAAPALVTLLSEPDPRLPCEKGEGKQKAAFVKEVVRLNHLSNCLLCHAPSQAKDDLVRGRVPVPGEDPPPQYYAESRGQFVRADTTYLRQDFSVVQPVTNPGKWAGQQRYDYVLRERRLTPAEVKRFQALREGKQPETYPHRESVLFALREVTGQDGGPKAEGWQPVLRRLRERPEPPPQPQPQEEPLPTAPPPRERQPG